MRPASTASIAILLAFSAAGRAADSPDAVAVKQVLVRYQAAVEALNASKTSALFEANSEIFESGSAEGNYANYLEHHLTPELAEFRTFKFSDYQVTVRVMGPVAAASETYRYRIETKQGAVAERLGVQTSVLRKDADGRWRIVSLHSSARKPPGGG